MKSIGIYETGNETRGDTFIIYLFNHSVKYSHVAGDTGPSILQNSNTGHVPITWVECRWM